MLKKINFLANARMLQMTSNYARMMQITSNLFEMSFIVNLVTRLKHASMENDVKI